MTIPDDLEFQPLAADSPHDNPNVQIFSPTLNEGRPVALGPLLDTEQPLSVWRYVQWNNSDPLVGQQNEITPSPLETEMANGELRLARTETTTALLEFFKNTDQFEVRLRGSTYVFEAGALAVPCAYSTGGTNFLLEQDLPSLPSRKDSEFWGWLFQLTLSVEASRARRSNDPCPINAGQTFLGMIFKVDREDPLTLFYQVVLSDTRSSAINDFYHLTLNFGNVPTNCLLARGADQYHVQGPPPFNNGMIQLNATQAFSVLLPWEQLQQDFLTCFPHVPAEDWFVSSLYYGLELEGVVELQVAARGFQFQSVWSEE